MKQILSLWDACPQGGKHRRSVFLRLLLLVCMLATTQAGWADNYTEDYNTPYNNGAAGAQGKGAFTVITTTGGFTYGNSSLQLGTNGASGTFTVSSVDGSFIKSIEITEANGYTAQTLSSEDGEIVKSNNTYTFTPSTNTKTSATFTVSAPSKGKTRLNRIIVNLTSDYEYLSKNFSVSSGVVSCTKSNASSDLTLTTTGSVSSYNLQIGNNKTLTITSAAHNIKAIHFTFANQAAITSLSVNTGTYNSNNWTAGNDTKTVTFTSSATNNIVGMSVELEATSSVTAPSFDKAAGTELVKNSGTVTLTSTDNTIYYKWNTTDNAYADAAALLADSPSNGPSSVDATAPSTTGTWYLYAVAYDGTSEYSSVAKRSYVITEEKTDLTGAWSDNPMFDNGDTPTIPTFSVTGGTLDTDYTVTYSLVSGSNVTVDSSTGIANINTNTAGTSVVRATINVVNTAEYKATTATYDCTITVNGTPLGSHTLTWEPNVNKSESSIGTHSKSSTSSYITVSNISNSGLTIEGSQKSNYTSKIATPATYDENKYMYVTFTVADGYQFTPTNISVKAQPVSTNKDVKLVLTDGTNSIEKTQTNLSQGTGTTVSETNSGATAFTGTVTLKIYCYGATDQYRLGSPITINGTVAAAGALVAPTITTQPVSATYTVDDTPTALSITATGSPAPEYQWYKNQDNDRTAKVADKISGATSATLPAESISTNAQGIWYYYCVATNSKGSKTSNSATITVNAAAVSSTADFVYTSPTDYGTASNSNKTFTKSSITVTSTSSATTGYLQVGADGSLTVSATSGTNITGITITYVNSDADRTGGTVTASTGTYSLSSKTGTWTGNANSITFSMSNKARIETIHVSYSASASHGITYSNPGGNHGTITGEATANEGETVTVTATPDAGYVLSNIVVTKVGGGTVTPSGSGNTRTFVMPSDNVTVTGNFVQLPQIQTSATNGTVTTSPAEFAAEGTTVTITATPSSGYALSTITVEDANHNNITVTNNQFTMPNSNVTVTATFVQKQVGTGDRWNFTRMNSSDDANYQSSAAWSSTQTSGRTIYQNSFNASTGQYAQVNSEDYATTAIEQIYNMKFRRVSGGTMSTNTYKIFKPSSASATDGYLQLNATNLSITLQGLNKGEQLTIYYSGSSTKGFILSNATVTAGGAEKIIGENTSATVTVTDDGDVEIKTESSGFKIYKIERGTVANVAEPTFSLADGTEQSTGTVSVTIESQQEANGGTVTTYYAFSNAPMTRAAIIAASTNFAGAKGTTQEVNSGAATQADIVLNAVTKYENGGTFYSEVVTATYPYTGAKNATMTVEGRNIQQGEERSLSPVFTLSDGTVFNPAEDEDEDHNSLDDYFDFTYTRTSTSNNTTAELITHAGNGVIKTKDASNNRAAVGDWAEFTVTATKKTGFTGTWPFANEGPFTVTNVRVTVIAKSSGFNMSFYWDPEFQHEVSSSEYHMGTGDESSVTIFDESVYNGRMFYAKPNDGYTIYVAAGTSSGSVKKVTTNSKSSGVNYYKYWKNDPADAYPDVPIEYNGMPILIEEDEWGGATEKFFYLNFHTYNNSTGTFEGSPVKSKFTVMKDDSKRPAPVTFDPAALNAERNTAETVLTEGETDAFIYGKFSGTGTSYTTPNLINEEGINSGVGNVGVFSTEVASRKISAVQVAKRADDEYYIGTQLTNTYLYKFASEIEMKSKSFNATIPDGGSAANVDVAAQVDKITYYNKDSKADIDISAEKQDRGSEAPIPTEKQRLTYSIQNFNGAEATIDENTGDVTIGSKSGYAVVTITYPGGYSKKVNSRTSTTDEATATYTIHIVKEGEQVPVITPGSRNFVDEQEFIIQAPNSWYTLYMVQKATDSDYNVDPATYSSADSRVKMLKAGEYVRLSVSETSKVRAFAFDYNEYQSGNPTKTGTHTSHEVTATYTKLDPLKAPTLSPYGTSENPHIRTTQALTIIATTNDAIAGLEVYYTTDGSDPTPTTGEQYNGSEKINISGASTTVKAIVYDPVSQRISPVTTGVYMYTGSIKQPKFQVNGTGNYTSGTITVSPTDVITITSEDGGDIYYTLNGATPTTSDAKIYDGSFKLVKATTGKAIAVKDDASSPITTVNFVFAVEKNDLWEAVEETTPKGKLAGNDRYVSTALKEAGTSTTSSKAVQYLTATFGGMDAAGWNNKSIGEKTQGTPLDGVGEYSIQTSADAWNENGAEVTNDADAVHERTFSLPAQGDFVRFEPERDGQLTIWLLQQGGLHYTDDGELCDKFIRLRPVYMFDEKGTSIVASNVQSSARLSDNWNDLAGTGNWVDLGKTQNGVTNKFYTIDESNKIYSMYTSYLGEKSTGDPIEPFEVSDGAVKNLLSGLGLTGTGYVMPSGGNVKYTFNVQAGKTYFFFGYRTKLCIRGFQFKPSEEETKNVTIANDMTDATSVFTGDAATKICNVTYSGRTFTSGVWNALVLPFSVSRTQLQKVFGNNVDVLHLDKTTAHSMEFKRHWYPMIVAGTPILIKSSETVTSPVFTGVHYEASSVTDVEPADGDYKMTGSFGRGSLKQGDYYVSTVGTIKYLTVDNNNMKSCRGWFKPKSAETPARDGLLMGTANAFGEEEWSIAGNPQPFVASDETITTYINGVQEDGIISNIFDGPTGIYTINGQLIRKDATSLEGLSKGIYIVNGKKIAIK